MGVFISDWTITIGNKQRGSLLYVEGDPLGGSSGIGVGALAPNGLKLNLRKSLVLILGSRAYVSQVNLDCLPPIIVDGTPLPYVREARNLGVVMSCDLSWNKHIATISRKINFTLHKLKYHKNAMSSELRTTLVSTLIFPIIDYCSLVYNDVSAELNIKLQRLINSSIRFIFNLRRDEHITAYRRQLGWLTVKRRRLYFMGIATFNVLNNKAPSYLVELFRLSQPSPYPARLATINTFHIPLHRTSTFGNSFVIAAKYFWHSLPLGIRSSPTLNTFKQRLFAHLFEQDGLDH